MLTQADQLFLANLEANGGEIWNLFASQRRKLMRHRRTKDEANSEALDWLRSQAMDNLKVSEPDRHMEDVSEGQKNQEKRYIVKPLSLNWSFSMQRVISSVASVEALIVFVFTMLLATTGYQVYAQHEVYGSGIEGWFLAIMLDLIFISVAFVPTEGLWANLLKYVILAVLICHMGLTMHARAVTSAFAENPDYQSRWVIHQESIRTLQATPDNQAKNRRQMIETIERQQKELDAIKASQSVTGTSALDVKTRIYWLNVLIQACFAHLMAYLLRSYYNRQRSREAQIWQTLSQPQAT